MKKLSLLLASVFVLSLASAQQVSKKDLRHINKTVYSQAAKITTQKATVEKNDKYVVLDKEAFYTSNHLRMGETRNAQDELNALYSLPDGFFYIGMTYNFYQFNYNEYGSVIHGPAFNQESPWQNLSTGANEYQWIFPNPQDPQNTFISIKENEPSVPYAPQIICPAPVLEAINGNDTAAFVSGLTTASSMVYGGEILQAAPTNRPGYYEGQMDHFGATNLDIYAYHLTTPRINPSTYFFGTGLPEQFLSCGEYFAKPSQTYVINEVRINLAIDAAPASTELKIIIHRVIDGIPTDTIATSTSRVDNAFQNEEVTNQYTLTFNGFNVKDEDGFEFTYIDLEIRDAILVEFTGYNKTGVSLGVFSNYIEPLDQKNTAYIYGQLPSGNKEWRAANTIDASKQAYNLCIILGLTYPYIVPIQPDIETEFNVPATGGSKILTFESWYEPFYIDEIDGEVIEQLDFDVPEWVSYEMKYEEEIFKTTITFTAEALPENLDSRSYDAKISSIGDASLTYKFVQNRNTSDISSPEKQIDIRILRNGTSLILENISDFNTVEIYNITGQLLHSYDLRNSGNTKAITPEKLSQGLYIFKFTGNKTNVIKYLY